MDGMANLFVPSKSTFINECVVNIRKWEVNRKYLLLNIHS